MMKSQENVKSIFEKNCRNTEVAVKRSASKKLCCTLLRHRVVSIYCVKKLQRRLAGTSRMWSGHALEKDLLKILWKKTLLTRCEKRTSDRHCIRRCRNSSRDDTAVTLRTTKAGSKHAVTCCGVYKEILADGGSYAWSM